jgi:hypothetical protein
MELILPEGFQEIYRQQVSKYMDTISFRINKGVRIFKEAPFVPQFEKRCFNDLSKEEAERSKKKNFRYLRHFRLHVDSNGIYTPQVEVYEKVNKGQNGVEYEMVVTLSLPKLLYGNNLQEIEVSDLAKLISFVHDRLYAVGIQCSEESILSAPVSVVHFCKNILLSKDMLLRAILQKISHADVGKAYDTTQDIRTKDNNNSEIIHLYCGVREWCFYDKVKDMKHSNNTIDAQILTEYHLKNTEVFRYEYRLKKAQTIRSEINNRLGRDYKVPVTVKDLFVENLWKETLLASWKKIIKLPENKLAFTAIPIDELDLFLHISTKASQKKKNGHSQNKALWAYGLVLAINKLGVKAVRQECERIWSKKADDRLDNKLKIAVELLEGLPLSEGILYVVNKLDEFKRIDLALLLESI